MERRPTVLVVTGPSGAGKGTLIHELVELVPGIEVTVSATTRERRRGEEDGREYQFLTDEDFLARVERGEFLEHVEYVSTAKVVDILMAVPKFGRVKATRFLTTCKISQSKTVGGLSDRQRTELIGLFNSR